MRGDAVRSLTESPFNGDVTRCLRDSPVRGDTTRWLWGSPTRGDTTRWLSGSPNRGETCPSPKDWSSSGETTRAPESVRSRSAELSACNSSAGGSPRCPELPRTGESVAAEEPRWGLESRVPPSPLDGEGPEPPSPETGEPPPPPATDPGNGERPSEEGEDEDTTGDDPIETLGPQKTAAAGGGSVVSRRPRREGTRFEEPPPVSGSPSAPRRWSRRPTVAGQRRISTGFRGGGPKTQDRVSQPDAR
ncbi:hypothetical protein A4R44_04327 [Amycolatopsis sp. M39]|nr:hypothetical protein A4R44_04327 [Amycolatopsis sp. M39]